MAQGTRSRPPRWLRFLLMAFLIVFASVAFYITFGRVAEELSERNRPVDEAE